VGGWGVVCCEQVCVSIICRDDGEGPDLQELPRMSYTRRYMSLEVESARGWGMLR
jgi:hypothetical protein